MGGLCSRRSTDEAALGGTLPHVNGRFSYGSGIVYQSRGLDIREDNISRDVEVADKKLREPFSFPELSSVSHGTHMDDVNDGIPRLSRALSDKSRSTRTKQVAMTKVCAQWILLICQIYLLYCITSKLQSGIFNLDNKLIFFS